MGNVWIGTSGYNYRDWKEIFYPPTLSQKQWLSYYASKFKTLELNAPFYRNYPAATYQKWATQVPEEFRFSVKGPRFITHYKQLHEVEESVEMFFNQLSGLGKKLNVVLWQFPKHFTFETDQTEKKKRLSTFLSLLPKTISQVVEFRDTSWYVDEIFTLLNTFSAGSVINDSPLFPKLEQTTGKTTYIRFHGPKELYNSSYDDVMLHDWAEKIKQYRKTTDVYCYFNNTMRGIGAKNAETLKHLL